MHLTMNMGKTNLGRTQKENGRTQKRTPRCKIATRTQCVRCVHKIYIIKTSKKGLHLRRKYDKIPTVIACRSLALERAERMAAIFFDISKNLFGISALFFLCICDILCTEENVPLKVS